jgi:hypothetical protein
MRDMARNQELRTSYASGFGTCFGRLKVASKELGATVCRRIPSLEGLRCTTTEEALRTHATIFWEPGCRCRALRPLGGPCGGRTDYDTRRRALVSLPGLPGASAHMAYGTDIWHLKTHKAHHNSEHLRAGRGAKTGIVGTRRLFAFLQPLFFHGSGSRLSGLRSQVSGFFFRARALLGRREMCKVAGCWWLVGVANTGACTGVAVRGARVKHVLCSLLLLLSTLSVSCVYVLFFLDAPARPRARTRFI